MTARMEKILFLLGLRLDPVVSRSDWLVKWAAKESAVSELFWGRLVTVILGIVLFNTLGVLQFPDLLTFTIVLTVIEIFVVAALMRRRAKILLDGLRHYLECP
jgi:hypothetical protein